MRLRLAPGFSVLADHDAVWLVAGEDVRYRLGAGAWLAELLQRCDGARSIDELAALAPAASRGEVAPLLARLVAERVLVAGTPAQQHVASPPAYSVVGQGAVAGALRAAATAGAPLVVFVQDRLDHGELLDHNAAMLAARQRWLWITTGPAQRAYVGPLLVPDAGACAACLLLHFKRLSPVPALYDALIASGSATVAAELPADAIATLIAFARWKLALVAAPIAPAALYQLHALEVADLTISAHAPIADPECEACRAR